MFTVRWELIFTHCLHSFQENPQRLGLGPEPVHVILGMCHNKTSIKPIGISMENLDISRL